MGARGPQADRHRQAGLILTFRLLFVAAVLFGQVVDAATISKATLAAWSHAVESTKQGAALPLECSKLSGQKNGVGPRSLIDSQVSEGDPSPQIEGKVEAIPSGLIHYWTGRVTIPSAQVSDLLDALQDYNSYSKLYAPAIVDSKMLTRRENEYVYKLKLVSKEFGIKAGLLATFHTDYHQTSRLQGYSITEAVELTELKNPETHGEEVLSADDAHGYVEKIFTLIRYRESEGTVVVELKSLVLSRGVPASVRWMIVPVLQRFTRRTMDSTLERLRDRVQNTQPLEIATK